MKKWIVYMAAFAMSANGYAQSEGVDAETRTELESSQLQEKENNHQISLDFVPTVLANSAKGLGISYSYRLVSNLSLGAYGSYFESDKFNSLFNDLTWTQATAGIESKYFLSNFGKGFYLGAAASYVYLKGEGTTDGLFSTGGPKVEDDADKFGYLAKMGYAFEGNTMKNGSTFIIDFALNYGTGNEFVYQTRRSGSQGSLKINEIRDGLGFYGALGVVF